MSSIIDSNVTILILGIILYIFGQRTGSRFCNYLMYWYPFFTILCGINLTFGI